MQADALQCRRFAALSRVVVALLKCFYHCAMNLPSSGPPRTVAADDASSAPVLVLLESPRDSNEIDGTTPLLGLTLGRRAELAARRAG